MSDSLAGCADSGPGMQGRHAPALRTDQVSVQTPAAGAAPVLRPLTAAALAKLVGREKRAVLLWVDPGKFTPPCPHRMTRDRRKDAPRFNLEEVRAWMAGQGLLERGDAAKEETVGRPDADAAPAPGAATAAANDPGDTAEGELGPVGGDADSLWKRANQLLDRELLGAVDFEAELVRVRAMGAQVFRERPDRTAKEIQLWTSALKQYSSELRALELAKVEARKRRGELVSRPVYLSVLSAVGAMFRADVAAMAADMPREVAAQLEGKVAPDQVELVRRVVAEAVKASGERVLRRQAEQLRRRAGEVAPAAPGREAAA